MQIAHAPRGVAVHRLPRPSPGDGAPGERGPAQGDPGPGGSPALCRQTRAPGSCAGGSTRRSRWSCRWMKTSSSPSFTAASLPGPCTPLPPAAGTCTSARCAGRQGWTSARPCSTSGMDSSGIIYLAEPLSEADVQKLQSYRRPLVLTKSALPPNVDPASIGVPVVGIDNQRGRQLGSQPPAAARPHEDRPASRAARAPETRTSASRATSRS